MSTARLDRLLHPRATWRALSLESRLVAGLFALAVLIGGLPKVFIGASAYAFFLNTYGADFLPYLYLGLAVIGPALGALYLRCERQLPFVTLLVGTLVLNTVALGLIWLGWQLGHPWVAFAAAAWDSVEWTLTNLVLWGLAGRVLDIRQGKRAFGLLGTGELLAVLAGGLLTAPLVALLGTPALLGVTALCCLLGALVVWLMLTRLVPQCAGRSQPERPEEQAVGIGAGPDRTYILSMLTLSALGILVSHFVDNAFFDNAARHYPTEDGISAFMGQFNAVAAAVGLCYRLFLSSRVFDLGNRVALLLPPLLLLLTGLAVVATGTVLGSLSGVFLVMTSVNKLCEGLGADAIQKGVMLSLYQPLAPKRRTGLQVITESVVEPLAGGVAGLLLLWCGKGWGYSALELTAITLGFVLLWLLLAGRLHGQYMDALGRALHQQRLGKETLALRDEATLTLLRQGLFSPRLPFALYCLTLLERQHPQFLSDALPRLLEHPEAAMRHATAGVVERHQLVTIRGAVERRLTLEAEPRVRGGLLRALAAVAEGDSLEIISPFLQDPNPLIQRDALVALLRYGGIEGIMIAGATLLQAAAAAQPERRRMVAEVVKEVADHHLYRLLLRLLADSDPTVRTAALDAAVALAAVPRLQQAALLLLQDRATARKAEAVLTAAGSTIIADLEQRLTDPALADWVKARVIAILGNLRCPAARTILEDFLGSAPWGLRHATLQALERSGLPQAPERQSALLPLVHDEVRRYTEWLAVVIDLDPAPSLALARGAIQREMARIHERIFILLSLSFPVPAMADARRQYATGSGEQRAYAIEVLDNLLPHALKGPVLPVLDDHAPSVKLHLLEAFHPQPLRGLIPRLTALPAAPTVLAWPWLLATLVHGAADLGGEAFQALAEDLHRHPHPLLRETAVRTALHWPAPRARFILTALADDPDPRVATLARRLRPRLNPPGETAGVANEGMPMSTIEKVISLKQVTLFASIPDEYLPDIANRMEEGESLPGEAIVRQGEWGHALFMIVSGQVRVRVDGTAVALMDAGEVFGELALLDPEPRSATVEAVTEVRHYRIDGQALDELMALEPSVGRNIIRMLCRRLREAHHPAIRPAGSHSGSGT
ncbi:MAG: cyclic nucleotide-binding domain-containing protein [Magnetococcales bacterium]|nr:cyclic nucleotide-binding domain-containing protein [Magnetococcales bacterium]